MKDSEESKSPTSGDDQLIAKGVGDCGDDRSAGDSGDGRPAGDGTSAPDGGDGRPAADGTGAPDSPGAGASDRAALSAAARARCERNRLRALALRDARLVRRPAAGGEAPAAGAADSGGGFLREAAAEAPAALRSAHAPLVHPSEQPRCMDCGRSFPQSFLFDTFDYGVCDDCRDDDDAHALITRTEAKSEFLLKDCDLDARPPPLRCVRRRNPHARRGDMRLYLRAQVEQRARDVWGSEEALLREREARDAARERARHKQTARRLRALRMDVRGSLYERAHAPHRHRFGAESRDAAADLYRRTCEDCGHVETYEKM